MGREGSTRIPEVDGTGFLSTDIVSRYKRHIAARISHFLALLPASANCQSRGTTSSRPILRTRAEAELQSPWRREHFGSTHS